MLLEHQQAHQLRARPTRASPTHLSLPAAWLAASCGRTLTAPSRCPPKRAGCWRRWWQGCRRRPPRRRRRWQPQTPAAWCRAAMAAAAVRPAELRPPPARPGTPPACARPGPARRGAWAARRRPWSAQTRWCGPSPPGPPWPRGARAARRWPAGRPGPTRGPHVCRGTPACWPTIGGDHAAGSGWVSEQALKRTHEQGAQRPGRAVAARLLLCRRCTLEQARPAHRAAGPSCSCCTAPHPVRTPRGGPGPGPPVDRGRCHAMGSPWRGSPCLPSPALGWLPPPRPGAPLAAAGEAGPGRAGPARPPPPPAAPQPPRDPSSPLLISVPGRETRCGRAERARRAGRRLLRASAESGHHSFSNCAQRRPLRCSPPRLAQKLTSEARRGWVVVGRMPASCWAALIADTQQVNEHRAAFVEPGQFSAASGGTPTQKLGAAPVAPGAVRSTSPAEELAGVGGSVHSLSGSGTHPQVSQGGLAGRSLWPLAGA